MKRVRTTTHERTVYGRNLEARLHPLFDLVAEIEALGLDTRPPGRWARAGVAALGAWRRLTRNCMREMEL